MARPHFAYFAPDTLQEAIGILQEYGDDAQVMAGGTDLLVKLNHRALKPKVIVGLKNIEGLDQIFFNPKKGLTIGAMALLSDVAAHPEIRKKYPGVSSAALGTANVQVRNMGTVVGNLCNAAPSADNAPMLLVLGGSVNIVGPEGERSLPLNAFFRGPGMTALETSEIVTSVHVPIPRNNTGTSYLSLSARGQVDCSAVGVGALLTMEGETCRVARIVVGACAPVPMRTPKAEKILQGKSFSEARAEKAAARASEETKPITDLRASAEYRWKIVAVVAKRALMEARRNAR